MGKVENSSDFAFAVKVGGPNREVDGLRGSTKLWGASGAGYARSLPGRSLMVTAFEHHTLGRSSRAGD